MRLIILLLAFTVLSFASGLNWLHSFEEAQARSIKEKKPILLFMSQPGCGSCKYMEENVFIEKKIIEYMNDNFIYAKLNIYDEEVPSELRTKATPVFYFLDEKKNHLIKKLIGGKTAPFFIKLLKEAKEAYKK